MNRIPPAVSYSLLRVLAFVVPLAILLLLGFNEWFSAIVAALIGFAVSVVFLRRSREQVAIELHRRRHGETRPHDDGPTDEEVEDQL